MFILVYRLCYEAAVVTDDVAPSINAELLPLGLDVGESVELFVAAGFLACDGIKVGFRDGFIASSKTK